MQGSLFYAGPQAPSQDIYLRVKNTTANPILKGSLVFATGVSDGIQTVALAQSDDPSTTRVIGMVTHDIGVGDIGFCAKLGSVGALNTNALAIGTVLYLSDATPGAWTSTAPSASSYPIRIGVISIQSATDGKIHVSIGPTHVAESVVILDLEINHDLRVAERLALKSSADIAVTVGGIEATHSTMLVHGDGGPVVITADPQITPGIDGQIVFLQGTDDTNTVELHDGDGLHLHSGSKLIIADHDYLVLQYHTVAGHWLEMSSNFKSFDTSWSFSSPGGSSGTFYIGGFYLHGSTSFTPAGGTNLGSALTAYAAHAFLVLGATSTGMVVRVTGTSITDEGVRTVSDFEDVDTSGGVLNDYFETSKKWLGQVSYSLQNGTGVVINNGLCKYWDNQNSGFRLTAVEVTGLAGANDSNPDFRILHHKPTGWTFNAGSEATPPTPVASMQADHSLQHHFTNGEPFAWKRVGLSQPIDGIGMEGVICQVITTANKSVETLNWTLSIRSH